MQTSLSEKPEIQHVILDFGGVIINLDYKASVRAFEEFGVKGFDAFYSQAKQTDLFDRLEIGDISPADFRDAIRQSLGADLRDDQIDFAWNALLLDYPIYRLSFLQRLKERFPLVMLSNTNAIHEKAFIASLQKEHGIQSLDTFFDKVYYSHTLGMRKPHTKTFLKVCELEGFNPSKTLFVDDSVQHVEGAEKAGLQAIWLEPGRDITNLLAPLLA